MPPIDFKEGNCIKDESSTSPDSKKAQRTPKGRLKKSPLFRFKTQRKKRG